METFLREKIMHNDLTPLMQERLNKWMANPIPVKNQELFQRKKPTRNFVARKELGDDLSDFQNKNSKFFNE